MKSPKYSSRPIEHVDHVGHGHHFHVNAFKNKEVDALYITLALVSFGAGLISVFVPVYLWELGYEIWEIILFYCLKSAFHICLLFLVEPLLRRMTEKTMMAVGIPFLVLYFFGLGFIEQLPILFYLLPIAQPLYMIFFWLGYHTDFANASDDDHVGEEVGANLMLSALVKFASPFIGGVLIGLFGFGSGFVVASIIMLLALVPLYFFPSRNVASDLSMRKVLTSTFKDNTSFRLSSLGYANEKMVDIIIWPLFIFLTVGSVEQLGGIISLGLLIGGLTTYISGRMSDNGSGRSIISFGALGVALVWFLRVFVLRPFMVVFSQVFYFIAHSATLSAWTSEYYRLAEEASSLSTFIVSQEFVYNVSRVLVLGLFSLIAYLVVNDHTFFSIVFAVAGLLSFFYLYANKETA